MKGSFFALEAIIAALMVITALGFLLTTAPGTLELSTVNYKLDAYNGLKISDNTGDLRKNTLNNNVNAIETELDPYISIDFDVAIYNKTTNITATPSLDEEDVITVSYFLAGEMGNYTPREVKVYLWGFD